MPLDGSEGAPGTQDIVLLVRAWPWATSLVPRDAA